MYQLGGHLVGDWIRLEGGVKILPVTSIFDLDIWGVLATRNPFSHLVMVVLTATFWLKLYEQTVFGLLFTHRKNMHVHG